MRITLVLATSTGGVGNHVKSLTAGLSARGAEVTVIGPPSTEEIFGFTAAGGRFLPVQVSGRPRPGADLAAVARMRRLLEGAGEGGGIVHAHGLRAGALAALARPSCPLAVTLHNAPPLVSGPLSAVYPMLERIVARRADLVLANASDLVARMRARGARTVELALVPAPAMGPAERDRAEVRAELKVPDDVPLLVMVARLSHQKGLPVLLDASRVWAVQRPELRVVVAGDGPLEGELNARIRAEGLPVSLLGRRTDVPDLLGAADAFVLTSVWEGPALVVQEALRAGLPVVATRVGGIPDLVSDAAVLVPSGDAAALAEAVERVLAEPELAARLRERARIVSAALPTEADAVEQVLSLYRRLVPQAV
ncbi:glycosyltransferase family 4 protein [Allonocardiopsis opalescens]|uniref:Glycosyltransferase involved in cell wall biosynthesis n=1 Tax=Allonocardiopsis opalescens TaxID=1144618 RepID=A0A2T0PQ45_9ACTN|nr:glycosyltransferase family 4 protein [Allonocardiopsis opalescens]PRX90928.1 glycosyltransferase involved in cell wall biosynthesis [Allonocardiopsis opalescens]